jgi:predicted anti-sigma-YlaC factor YlaD
VRRDPSDRPCGDVREAISAALDGEEAPLAAARVRDHLDGCAACTRYADAVPSIARSTRVGEARQVPDLTAPILVAVTEQGVLDGRRRVQHLRLLVALAGLVQLALAVPTLAGVTVAPLHLGRDLGSLQLALAVGLLVAAWQPRRAAGVLPIATVVAGAAIVTGVVDVVTGVATVVAELTHLAEVVGVLALWLLTRTSHEAAVEQPLFEARPAELR